MKKALIFTALLLISSTAFAQVGDDWTLDQIPSGSMVLFNQTVVLPASNSDSPVKGYLFDQYENDDVNRFIECDLSANTGSSSYQISAGQSLAIRGVDLQSPDSTHTAGYLIHLGTSLNLTIFCSDTDADGTSVGSVTVGEVNTGDGSPISIKLAAPKPVPTN